MGLVLRRPRGLCDEVSGYGLPAFATSLGSWAVLGIKAYARIAGIALLVVAAGLALFGEYPSAIYYHAGVGLFFLLVGFSRLEITYVRQMVGGFGVLLVAIGGTAILATWLSPMRYLHGPIEITSVIAGLASVLAARYLPDRRSKRRGRRAS
jgi:hypothetical protein